MLYIQEENTQLKEKKIWKLSPEEEAHHLRAELNAWAYCGNWVEVAREVRQKAENHGVIEAKRRECAKSQQRSENCWWTTKIKFWDYLLDLVT